MVLGVRPRALVSGLSRWGEAIIDGPVQIKRAIPALALLPLLILWLGIGESMKVVTDRPRRLRPRSTSTPTTGCAASTAGTSSSPRPSGCPPATFLRRVVLPGALPGLPARAAVRGHRGAWLCLVVVEQINSTSGIGYMMELARTYGQTDVIIVGLVLYGAARPALRRRRPPPREEGAVVATHPGG